MLVNSTTVNKLNPGDIIKLLYIADTGKYAPSSTEKILNKSEININGKIYREVQKHVICYLYKVSSSLVDSLAHRGSNGQVAGNYLRAVSKHVDRNEDVHGIDNHEIISVPLVTVGSITLSTSGEVSVIMHQHACHEKNKTIHSYPKIEHYKNVVDDRSIKVGGVQHTTTLNNCKLPMSIRNSLP